jgi:galactose mutarotase-like enzyme
MKYLGIWQKPNTDAPYICLEPWSMLPASENGMDDFETKEDIVHLPMGKTYRNTWMVEIV